MAEIHADGGPLPHIPDDLTISQFMLDAQHPVRPVPVPSQPWLIDELSGRRVGVDELRARTAGLANALKIRWGIGEDDVVCLYSPNHIDYIVAMWAVHQLGAIVTTANPAYNAEELAYQLSATKTQLIVTSPTMISVALDAARSADLQEGRVALFDPAPGSGCPNVDDLITFGLTEPMRFTERRLGAREARSKLAFLLFSSGTTGPPKAVMISHYSLVANLVQTGHYLRLTDDSFPTERKLMRPGDVSLVVLPLYHAYGLHVALFGSLFFGCTAVISPRFHLDQMLESIQKYGITHLYLVPPHAVLMCKSPVVKDYDLSSVKALVCGAAPVSAELTKGLVQILPKSFIGQGYGMTESATLVSWIQHDKRVGTLGCAGILLPGITARVVRPDGSLAAIGEPGELHVKGPSLALGYLNNPSATAGTFKDGWLITGDEVIINERNELFVVDRIKELIKVRGLQVAPSELEGHLFSHPDVADVCVIGIPDEYSGELPFAFVVLRDEAQKLMAESRASEQMKSTIMKHVSDHKTRFKWLAGVEFVEAIPKNPSGKLLRRVLRDKAKKIKLTQRVSETVRAKL